MLINRMFRNAFKALPIVINNNKPVKSDKRMNTLSFIFLLGLSCLVSYGRKPELPEDGMFPFIVYFESRSRGLCVGSLVSRVVVLTAAVCVAGPNGELHDRRPISVVTGTRYRHPLRGIRVQAVRVLMPKLPDDTDERRYMLQTSVALLLLRRRIPDVMVEQPLRAIGLDYSGEDLLTSQGACITVGWHFLYAEDGKLPEQWWLLHRHMRYQVLQFEDKKDGACAELVRAYEKTANYLKHVGDVEDVMCFRDPNNTAQPCHGMYGAPLVCAKGQVVGLLMAPSAQWRLCDRMSILVHKLSSQRNKAFLECFEALLQPEYLIKWELFTNNKVREYRNNIVKARGVHISST